ncbi:MAG: flagellar basal body-associated FliL family protein [Hyphomonas sp.]|nr:flagellar basal body-associated FliL family protein [Hyphomonas sp.]
MAGKEGGKADKKAAPEGGETGGKSGGGMMGMVIVAVGALAASFGTVYMLSPTAPATDVAACSVIETAEHIEPTFNPNQTYVELDDLVVTIGSAPATRYLKLKISVITESNNASTISQAEPVLVDAFTNYLRSVEVSDFENPGFYAHMREQLGRRAQLVLGSGASEGVLITEFLLR